MDGKRKEKISSLKSAYSKQKEQDSRMNDFKEVYLEQRQKRQKQ
jgi:hypothetical protein